LRQTKNNNEHYIQIIKTLIKTIDFIGNESAVSQSKMVRNSQTRTPNEYEIDTSKLNAKQARLIEKNQ
jgi:hypothetical protein